MKYILSVLFLFFFFSGFTQIYQEMPQYGYRANRMAFDSTLQIPTVCGVPTLKSVVSVRTKSAIAFDSCNNKFYTYNPKTQTWSEVSGGGNPTFQNVIDNGNLITKNDTIKLNEQTRLNFTGKASGNQTYPLLDIYNGNSGGIIWMRQFSDPLQQIFFSTNFTYLSNDDISINTTTGLNITNGDINMVNDNKINFLNTSGGNYSSLISDANNDGNDKLHHLPNLYQVYNDTLATTLDIRNNTIDTSNRFVNDVVKKNDSTITVYKGSTATDITLTPSATVTAATRLVTTVYNNSGVTIAKGSVVYINGRHSSNLPTIALAQANTEGNSYATFALVQDNITNGNSGTAIQAGNIGNLNLPTSSYADGEVVYLSATVAGGITVNKNSVLAPNHIVKIGTITRAHPTLGSIEIKIENGWQLDELSDVKIAVVPNDSTLFQFSRVDSLWHDVSVTNAIGNKYLKPTDSVSLSNRINLKVNISDTATMLSKYLRKTDTASLSSRIDLRVKYTDTSTMLTPYLRKVDTTNRFVNNISRTVGKDSIIFNIGSTRYAIKDSVGSGGTSYTFSTGLTNTSGTVTSNLSTGVAGGQSVVGGTAASNSLTLSSTSNATKGKLLFGTSAYDEVNNRLGIGTTTPISIIQSTGSITASSANAKGVNLTSTLVAAANGDTLTGLDVNTTYTNGAFTGVQNYMQKWSINGVVKSYMRVYGQTWLIGDGTTEAGKIEYTTPSGFPGILTQTYSGGSYVNRFDLINRGSSFRLGFDASNGGLGNLSIFNTGNVVISSSGMTDAGYKLDVNGTARVQGALNFNPTNTASGTTGNQTINKASGTVNIAAAGTTVTVTNSLVSASSIVYAVIRTNDSTATIKNVVPAAGSFVINLGAAATAEVSIGFFVIN